MRARELYPRTSFARSRLPASQLRGESGAASLMRARTAWQVDCSVHAGLQALFRMSRQISPVCTAPDCQHLYERCAMSSMSQDPIITPPGLDLSEGQAHFSRVRHTDIAAPHVPGHELYVNPKMTPPPRNTHNRRHPILLHSSRGP
jgi:hypothetical protein